MTARGGPLLIEERPRTAHALRLRAVRVALVAVFCLSLCGCTASRWVTVRPKQEPPILEQWNVLTPSPIEPSDRTMQLLRRYDLAKRISDPPEKLLAELNTISAREPTADTMYALAEVAYLNAKRSERGDKDEALKLYGTAVSHAYVFLFDGRFRGLSNPYDPQFRGACDVYNGALEGMLRLLQERGQLACQTPHQITSGPNGLQLTIETTSGSWNLADFERLEFASDYQVVGLRNHYRQFGLGVPLVAVRRKQTNASAQERYYPPNLTFPVTAFLRMLPDASASGAPRAVLEFHDPLEETSINIAATRVPMESDLSTPLAYFLNAPQLDEYRLSTKNLLQPIQPDALNGLFMLEPYRPGKIPVLMVHGFWSTPVSWMEMFNDLRGMPQIRDNFQFWFYMYPTGQPFWNSATQLRRDLAQVQQQLDPEGRDPALREMVLVGHSMGGLLSRMQTIESGDTFWKLVSKQPLDALRATQPIRTQLAETFYFRPNPSVRQVITIATPHQGSDVASSAARWLGQKLITLPERLVGSKQKLKSDNPDAFFQGSLIDYETSIDSLAPNSPILAAMWSADRSPRVHYHNIVAKDAEESDGVVTFASARTWDAESEVTVEADHVNVHKHPRTILEVRRILLDHLARVRAPIFQQPDTPQTANAPKAVMARH